MMHASITMGFSHMAVICCLSLGQSIAGDQIDEWIAATRPPARFADYRPAFSVDRTTISFQDDQGQARTQPVWLVHDGTLIIAIWALGANHWDRRLDVVTLHPGDGLTTAALKKKLMGHSCPGGYDSMWTPGGIKLSTGPWVPLAVSPVDVLQDDAVSDVVSATLVSRSIWRPDGCFPGRDFATEYRFTISVDPVLGYVVGIDQHWDGRPVPVENSGSREPGYIKMLTAHPGGLNQAWPDQNLFSWSFATQPSGLSARAVTAGRLRGWRLGGGIPNGGCFGWFADAEGWGLAVTRQAMGPGPNLAYTCPLFLSPEFVQVLPPTSPDGRIHAHTKERAVRLPPEVIALIRTQMIPEGTPTRQRPMIRPGRVEDFSDQPFPFDPQCRGVELGLGLADGIGRQQDRCLVLENKTGKEQGVWSFPALRLNPGRSYLLRAWMKIEGSATAAWRCCDTYRKKPAYLHSQPVPADGQWHLIEIRFPVRPEDFQIELKFGPVIIGEGRLLIDDVLIDQDHD